VNDSIREQNALALLEHAPVGVYWTRRDGSFAYVNQAAAEMLGFSHQELIARNIFAVDAEIDSEFWSRHWSKSSTPGPTILHRNHVHRNGALVPVEVHIRNLIVDKQHYHFSFVIDMRETLRAESIAKQHEHFYQTVFSNAPLPQFMVDPKTMRILDANLAARNFYGYGDALVGMTIPQINTLDQDAIREKIDLARSKHRHTFEIQHRLASGEIREMHIHTGPVRWQDRLILHSTNIDVTARNTAARNLESFRDLIHRLPIGIFRTEIKPDGKILAANPALANILKASSTDDLIGQKVTAFYPLPNQRERFLEQLTLQKELKHIEHQLVGLDGETIWVNLTARLIDDGTGQPIIEGAVENITARKYAEMEREAAYRMFFDAVALAPIPIMLHRADGTIAQVNRIWSALTGYPVDKLKTIQDWAALAYGRDADSKTREIADLATLDGRKDEGDFEIHCADGSKRIWSFYSGPLEDAAQPNRLIMSTAVDVTEERKHLQQARLADIILQTSTEGVTVTDAQKRIVRVNPAFTRITGYRQEEVLGRNPRILASGRQGDSFYAEMWQQIETTDHWQGEIWNRRKSGEIYPEWMSISAIRDSDGNLTNYAAVFTDLTELKHTQGSLERLRRFDPLTGLLNRNRFIQMIKDACEQSRLDNRSLAVMVLGVDRLSRVNQSMSYECGDQVLKHLAQHLTNVVGKNTILGRNTGDQFVLLLRAFKIERAVMRQFRTIRTELAQPFDLGPDTRIPVSLTAGVALAHDGKETPESLLQYAESAMFSAKNEQSGSISFFDPERTQVAREKLAMETDLRQAIEANMLVPHFQPIVSVADRRIVGAEALARWAHPDRGSVSPVEFIPLAEETGLIERLSLQLLEKAVSAAARFRNTFGDEFFLAFNVSVTQVKSSEFILGLRKVLQAAGFPPERFEIELTESALMRKTNDSSTTLKNLRSDGFRLSIDDFGTGYSSLAYLQELDAQVLKIDQRFVQDLGNSRAGEQITESIIAMAGALKMQVIAEGVETADQFDRLRTLGCQMVQGYLIRPPLPADEFAQLSQPLR